jgi:hypothetical protein
MKTVAVWTLMPLLFTPAETVLKHMIFLLDIVLSERYLTLTKHRIVYRSLVWVILIIQGWQVMYVEVWKGLNEYWMYRYQ